MAHDLEDNQDGAGTVELVTEALTGLSLPAPIKRSLFQVVGRLMAASADVPLAYLEGLAEERRAETAARKVILARSAQAISEGLVFDPAYAQAAVRKFGERILRERVNIDRIVAEAVTNVATAPHQASNAPSQDDAEVSEEFLHQFEAEAAPKSSAEMRSLFAKILAGEIVRPSSFSIKTLRAVGNLDAATITLFSKACALAISLRLPNGALLDLRIPAVAGAAGNNGLRDYGLSFNQLNHLFEYGLIISDYNSWMSYTGAVPRGNVVALPLMYCEQLYALAPDQQEEVLSPEKPKVSGVAFSQVGKELFSVVDKKCDSKFTEALTAYFKKNGYELTGPIPSQ